MVVGVSQLRVEPALPNEKKRSNREDRESRWDSQSPNSGSRRTSEWIEKSQLALVSTSIAPTYHSTLSWTEYWELVKDCNLHCAVRYRHNDAECENQWLLEGVVEVGRRPTHSWLRVLTRVPGAAPRACNSRTPARGFRRPRRPGAWACLKQVVSLIIFFWKLQ